MNESLKTNLNIHFQTIYGDILNQNEILNLIKEVLIYMAHMEMIKLNLDGVKRIYFSYHMVILFMKKMKKN